LLIPKISNGISVAKILATEFPLLKLQRNIRCWLLASDYPLLIVSNGISVAAKSATDKSVAKKSATTNLHPIFAVADSVAKLF
jgi:hypothetical protein